MLAVLAGCATSSTVMQATPIAPLREPSYAERPLPVAARASTKQRYGTRDLFEPVIVGRDVIAQEAGWRAQPQVIDVAEIDYLGRCAKDYVLGQPEGVRRSLVSVFAHYVVSCDAETGLPRLERPLGLDARDRRGATDATFLGSLSPGGGQLVLRLTSCGTAETFDRVTLVGGELVWTSQRVEVRRRHDGCDVAELPYSRRLATTILRMTESGASSIRFEGTDNAFAIDDLLREELRDVIAAVDAITER